MSDKLKLIQRVCLERAGLYGSARTANKLNDFKRGGRPGARNRKPLRRRSGLNKPPMPGGV